MYKMNLRLKEKVDGSLVFSLGILFRIILLVIAAVLVTGAILSAGSAVSTSTDGISWFQMVLILLCTAGSLYEEKWLFSRTCSTIEHRSGFIFLSKKTVLNINDIESFELSSTLPIINASNTSKMKKQMVRFSLIPVSGQKININMVNGIPDAVELKLAADRISDYCGVKLVSNQ